MSIRTWFRDVQCFFAQLISDDSGRPSLSKGNLLIGATTGCFVVIKMAILGTLTEIIFGTYLAFCAGHHLVSKQLDRGQTAPSGGEMIRALWGTFGTWLKAFNGPCLWACVGAAAVGGWGAGLLTYKIQDARVARAEARFSDLRTDIADARADMHNTAAAAADTVLEARDEQQKKLDAMAATVADVGRRLQLCATKSDVRVTVTPSGAIETVPGGQQRELAEAVREWAEACAAQRDNDANDHNALIDWLEKVTKRK